MTWHSEVNLSICSLIYVNFALCYLFEGVADEIELEDFEECLLDFMEMKFSMELEDNSAKEVL